MSGGARTVLELRGISKRFGDLVAVDDVSLAIRENEFFALLGPSGCGKTTLLRLLAGFERPNAGTILLDGEDIAPIPPNRRPLNLMFQSYALFEHMSARGNIAYGLEMERLPRAEIDRRVDEILEVTGLADAAGRRPAQLSGGQRQRVALARAVIKRPRVLLLDEPLGALDKKLRESMQLELKRLQHEIGITFVVVTHDQEEALVMADRIAVLERGRLRQVGTPHEVYEYPASRFVAQFIGVMNFFDGVATADGVRLGDGTEFAAPPVAAIPPGAPATLAVRPERLTLATAASDNLANRIDGRVAGIAYHGLDLTLSLETTCARRPVMVRIPASANDRLEIIEGSRVGVAWEAADSRILARADAPRTETTKPEEQANMTQKTIAFFPEAAFGPALNSVGIAQACEKLGHRAVFLSDPGFVEVYRGYGFDAHPVNLSEPMSEEEMAKFWENFINGHIPNFSKSPYDQIDNYVKECWENIVDSAKWAEKDLPGVLAKIDPDIVCVDNVILFPAIKQYGKPWVRIISCSENEIEDPAIPPHLSGCKARDSACHDRYRQRFNEVIKPVHDDFNAFLAACGEDPYPLGLFFEASPHMNLLLYPEPVKYERAEPLDPARFQYLEGCVREEEPYTVPEFKANDDKPLLYVSYGSLGAGDTELLKRVIDAIGRLPYRALVNVGDYGDAYDSLPDNVIIEGWYPQPSVIPQVDCVIHHGGNNSFTECLYFGKPAIIMPYVWDGHDNATRVEETGHGFYLHRYDWSEADLAGRIERCLGDADMRARLAATSEHMQSRSGTEKAASVLDRLLR